MQVRHAILATAGHVDHGKSALVKALTGVDPDRLPEEKARGITIDLGFAHLELASTTPDSEQNLTFSVGIVDVPGHEDFVKNMVAGVGSVDLALLVVAADDGWMPQTEEHLQILAYLGVTRAVVALSKIDLAVDEQAVVVEAIRDHLQESPLAQAPIVPTSVLTGQGLPALRSALENVLNETPAPRDIGKPRLPVDRVFSLRGIGTVVTGTLTGGTLERSQAVILQPSGQTARIRNLQTHLQDVASSPPGTRTALNLPELAPSSETNPNGVNRGEILTLPGLGGPVDTVDVWLTKSARLRQLKTPAARPLPDGTRVRVHFGSANLPARVRLRETTELAPGESSLAELRLEAPAYLFDGDRFLLRDWSEQTTLAGGIVLEAQAQRSRWRSAAQKAFLQSRAERPNDARTFLGSLLVRDGWVRRPAALRQSRFSLDEVGVAAAQLVADGHVVVQGELWFDADWLRGLEGNAAEAIDAEHRVHPERPGLTLTALRAALGSSIPNDEVFAALLARLSQIGFAQREAVMQRVGHRMALPPALAAAGTRLRSLLAERPLDPPSRKELAAEETARQALRFLAQTGETVEVGAELVLLRTTYDSTVAAIRTHLQAKGQATVSELRQLLGTSRRVMVPLLERLDREGITRRDGDFRRLK